MTSRRPLHPREPQLPPLPGVREPTPKPVYSRWQGSSTAFGPRGRIAATALALLFLWMSFFYILLPLWLILVGAGVKVLRDVWKKTLVLPETPHVTAPAAPAPETIPEQARRKMWSLDPRPEPVTSPRPRWLVGLWVLAGLAFVGISVAWAATGNVGHSVIGMTLAIVALVVAIAWLRPG